MDLKVKKKDLKEEKRAAKNRKKDVKGKVATEEGIGNYKI